MENRYDFLLITPRKYTSFSTDSEISSCFFQYPLKFYVLNSPCLSISGIGWQSNICFVSIILKEIRLRQLFMSRQLKTADSLKNSDEVVKNLAISEANICRGSTKHSYS